MTRAAGTAALEILRSRGFDASIFEPGFFANAVARRARARDLARPEDYEELLARDPGEPEELRASLYVSYSEFFRDPLAFACLERLVLPELLGRERRDGSRELRIWSAACAGGQEAYSLAMLCEEASRGYPPRPYRIFATDISEEALERARLGLFGPGELGRISLGRLHGHFSPRGEEYELSSAIRRRVEFSRFDLLDAERHCPPSSVYGAFDLVVCCNLLIYYNEAERALILERLGSCLAEGGYLVTGEAEREIAASGGFREAFPASGVFRARD